MVGKDLRKKREEMGLSLQDVSSLTQIRTHYLRALENNNFEKIPSEFYVKGYLRLYAKTVGLDEKSILSTYYVESEKQEKVYDKIIEPPNRPSRPLVRYFKIAAILTLLLFFVFTSLYYYWGEESDQGKASLIMRHRPAQAHNEQIKTHSLTVEALETTWLVIVIDNEKVEEYLLRKGNTLSKQAMEGFYLKIGNGGGIDIFFDNKNIGKIGERGEVVSVALPEAFRLNKSFEHMY